MVTLGNRLEGQGYHLWLVMLSRRARISTGDNLGPLTGYLVLFMSGSHENTKVKQPKAGIVLGLVIFLGLDFGYTLPPMVHPSNWGYLGKLENFNQPSGDLGALSWGR